MSIVEYFASNPQAGALVGLTLIVVFVGLGMGLIVGRAGEELAFVFGLGAPMRKLMARVFGASAGLLVGLLAGGVLGGGLGLGPDHVLVGLSSFLGLSLGTFLGGLGRSLENPGEEDRAMDRFRWVVWRYTSLELESAVGLSFGAFFGAICGAAIEFAFRMYPGGFSRFLQIGLGGLLGAALGAAAGSIISPHARIFKAILGMAIGVVAGSCLGLFLVSIGKTHGYLVPGLIFGSVGGACFGVVGGDRMRDKVEI